MLTRVSKRLARDVIVGYPALTLTRRQTGVDYLQHRGQFDPDNLYLTLIYFGAFMALDVAVVAIAFAMEKREEWGLLPLIAAQRFGYRQLLYYVVVKSIFSATSGVRVGWGKLERKGSVSGPEGPAGR